MSDKLVKLDNGLQVPAEAMEFYKQNADVGSENLGQSIPQLKVTEANSQNEQSDGQFAPAGTFYYTPTQEVFKSLRVSVLTISRGFYALDNSDDPKPKFTQLMGGMILDGMKPFVMFVSGTRLNNMWDFGKKIRPLTKNKQYPIPMFSMQVDISLERYQSNHGVNHVVKYDLVKNDKGYVDLITDVETLNFIRAGVDQVEEMFASFIDSKEVDKESGRLLSEMREDVHVEDIVDAMNPEDAQKVVEATKQNSSPESEELADDVPF